MALRAIDDDLGRSDVAGFERMVGEGAQRSLSGRG
jgi:hypothetical protein